MERKLESSSLSRGRVGMCYKGLELIQRLAKSAIVHLRQYIYTPNSIPCCRLSDFAKINMIMDTPVQIL